MNPKYKAWRWCKATCGQFLVVVVDVVTWASVCMAR